MDKSRSHTRGYILAGLIGAAAGGVGVAIFTRAIPVLLSRLMSGMMENMMSQMGAEGCDPEEM
jgi:hypothetical protein